MASFEFEIEKALIQQLEELNNIEETTKKMLEEAAVVLQEKIVKETDRYHEYSNDHELVNSITKTKINKKADGSWNIMVRPSGKDQSGVRNMEKMAHLEYGYRTRNGKQLAPKPILTKAVNESNKEVIEKLQEVYEREAKAK